MGCSSSSAQTVDQEKRPGTKPEEFNGSTEALKNGFIAEDAQTIEDQMQLPVQTAIPNGLQPGTEDVMEVVLVALEAQEDLGSGEDLIAVREAQEEPADLEKPPVEVAALAPEGDAVELEVAVAAVEAPSVEEEAPVETILVESTDIVETSADEGVEAVHEEAPALIETLIPSDTVAEVQAKVEVAAEPSQEIVAGASIEEAPVASSEVEAETCNEVAAEAPAEEAPVPHTEEPTDVPKEEAAQAPPEEAPADTSSEEAAQGASEEAPAEQAPVASSEEAPVEEAPVASSEVLVGSSEVASEAPAEEAPVAHTEEAIDVPKEEATEATTEVAAEAPAVVVTEGSVEVSNDAPKDGVTESQPPESSGDMALSTAAEVSVKAPNATEMKATEDSRVGEESTTSVVSSETAEASMALIDPQIAAATVPSLAAVTAEVAAQSEANVPPQEEPTNGTSASTTEMLVPEVPEAPSGPAIDALLPSEPPEVTLAMESPQGTEIEKAKKQD